jgi:hypothetical protein
MPVQMMELEEVTMVEASDEQLENISGALHLLSMGGTDQGTCAC